MMAKKRFEELDKDKSGFLDNDELIEGMLVRICVSICICNSIWYVHVYMYVYMNMNECVCVCVSGRLGDEQLRL